MNLDNVSHHILMALNNCTDNIRKELFLNAFFLSLTESSVLKCNNYGSTSFVNCQMEEKTNAIFDIVWTIDVSMRNLNSLCIYLCRILEGKCVTHDRVRMKVFMILLSRFFYFKFSQICSIKLQFSYYLAGFLCIGIILFDKCIYP